MDISWLDKMGCPAICLMVSGWGMAEWVLALQLGLDGAAEQANVHVYIFTVN